MIYEKENHVYKNQWHQIGINGFVQLLSPPLYVSCQIHILTWCVDCFIQMLFAGDHFSTNMDLPQSHHGGKWLHLILSAGWNYLFIAKLVVAAVAVW